MEKPNDVISPGTFEFIFFLIICFVTLALFIIFLVEILLKKYFPKLQIKININIPKIITKIYNIIFFIGFTLASFFSVFALLLLLVYYGCFLCDKIQYLFS